MKHRMPCKPGPSMPRTASFLLINLVFSHVFHLSAYSANATPVVLTRRALFSHQTVLTARSQEAQSRRGYIDEAQAHVDHRTWLLGLPTDQQDAVHATLTAHEAEVLHPVPGDDHHWVIVASTYVIEQLLNAHPELSAATMPDEVKISPSLKAAIDGTGTSDNTIITMVALMPSASPAQTAIAVRSAENQLAPIIGQADCALQVKAGANMLRVSVCRQDLSTAVNWLAGQPRITWVELAPRMMLHNLAAAAAMQSPAKMQAATLPANIQSPNSGLFPYWQAGLDGRGQVVGVVDSGLDMDSCFFYDPAVPNYQTSNLTKPEPTVKFGKAVDPDHYIEGAYRVSLGGKDVFRDPNHRKVVSYAMFGGDQDYYGHGTGVAGIIAGNAYGSDYLQNPSMATGVAPGAKLAIFDVGTDSFGSDPDSFAFGDADPGQIYDNQRQAGARISTNAWGTSQHGYSAPICYIMDAYTWGQQDMLHVFAAGNDGASLDLSDTIGSVTAPASCKNVLSVGATESWIDESLSGKTINLVGANGKQVALNLANWKGPTPKLTQKISLAAADGHFKRTLIAYGTQSIYAFLPFTGDDLDVPASNIAGADDENGPPDMSFKSGFEPLYSKKSIKLALATPSDACKKLTKSYASADKTTATVVLVAMTDSSCDGAVALQNVYSSGADGVLMFWDNPETPELWRSGSSKFRGKTFPAATIHPLLGWELQNTLQTTPGSVSMLIEPLAASPIPTENVAWFSSFGSGGDPTEEPSTNFNDLDVRIKPDMVAPGYTLTAASDGSFDGGAPDQCAVTTAQGTSVAAPIVSGAAAIVRQYFMDGYYPTGKATATSKYNPSAPLVKAVLIAGTAALKGISRVNSELLAPPPSPFQGFGRLDLSASLPLAGDAKQWRMQMVDGAVMIRNGEEQKYQVTATAGKPLIITLVYHDFPAFPGSKYVLVNDLDLVVTGPDGKVLWGNNVQGGDYHNNVEKVVITNATAGVYYINVQSSFLFVTARPQPYALVVLGGFNGTLVSKANPAA